MSTCAVCQLTDGLVINVIVAEVTDPAPEGTQLVVTPSESGTNANIGMYWNGTDFVESP